MQSLLQQSALDETAMKNWKVFKEILEITL
jgi:hypothetical protein